ncbi:MAG: hypothetical protein ACYDEA_08045 [Candidatus Dormibacteria bacterium]
MASFVFQDAAVQPCVLNGLPEVHLYGSANQQIAVDETHGQATLNLV